jgi:hypothetical protein
LGIQFGAGAMIGVLLVRYVLQVAADILHAGLAAFNAARKKT